MGLPDSTIPEAKLPPCWSDDVRMNALFAPFRLKSANPESWDMKMKFWSEMLRLWCKCKNDPIVSTSDAKLAFQRKGRTPACLDIVIEEMFRNGELSPLTKYQQILHNGPEGWVRWGARLAFKPAAFALTAVASLLPARQAVDNDGLPKASIDSTQRFVLECVVQEQATTFLQNYPPTAERIGTIEELMKNVNWQQSRETFEVLLGYLVSQGTAVKKDDVVKLAEPNKKASPITESDEAFVKLIAAERKLEADATRFSKEVAAAEMEAKAALQLGNRLAAKNHLRRKHTAEKRALRSEAALDNVRQLLQQMKDVEMNSHIVDTYRTSSQAMKRGMKEGGLDEDAVHDTMDDLKDVLDTYNEVERALSTTVDDFDAAELEQELKDLLASPSSPGGGTRAKEKDGRRVSDKLPTPPADNPHRKVSERDFIFDGEERIIAELNELGIEDSSPKQKDTPKRKDTKAKQKVPVAEAWGDDEEPVPPRPKSPKSKSWYPPSGQFLTETWNNNDSFGELRQDDRLHPGQQLNVDFTTPPRLYNTDFLVRDHKPVRSGGNVWLYNRDDNSNFDSDLATSTEYYSSESPGKAGGSFQMAPGGERKPSATWQPPDSVDDVDDLEERSC
ncbi:charged multivesicular body protein 7 isoform X2 [Hyposmocoma kahamanoa]|uniref:charged multivesicular body protein 7 isoform X2 n=1 Tax=Hyposmocoma kahamanoa TaxID=1477025 RepID=UPI000E6D7235|nr:charged multivesicular body protein 7 isoform X2 [Hyposmocoma kahamanoa]